MPESNESRAVRTVLFSIVGNFALAAIKAVAGTLGHSYALIADAIESTTDGFTSILVLIGIKYTNKPADKNHPYGHGRAEPLITFMVAGFLLVSATIIIYESIKHIRVPHQLPSTWTLYLLGAIILWKEISYQVVASKARQLSSSSLKADAWHHRADAITSIAAFIGISIAIYLGPGHESADDWAALFASGIIYFNSYIIFRPALGEVMDEHVYEDLVTSIREVALTVNGVLGTEKCHIRKAGMAFHVDLHAVVSGEISVRQGHAISHDLKDKIRERLPQVAEVLIHIEPDTE